MIKIACLGTSHTAGMDENRNKFEFYDSWPGILSEYLTKHNIDNYIYNAGEPGAPLDFYPTKILNLYNEFKPDMFIIEVPDTDKIDIDMSDTMTGDPIEKRKTYHKIFSRQIVTTKDWVKGEEQKHKVNFARAECVDFYHKGIDKKDVEIGFKGSGSPVIDQFYQSFNLDDRIKDIVSEKFNELKKGVGAKNFPHVLSYLYTKSVITDGSDTEMTQYLSTILGLINTFKVLGIKFLLYKHTPTWFTHHNIFLETYKPLLNNPEYWLTGNMFFNFRDWTKTKAQAIESEHHWKILWKEMFVDIVHFKPYVFKMFVDELMGPAIKKLC